MWPISFLWLVKCPLVLLQLTLWLCVWMNTQSLKLFLKKLIGFHFAFSWRALRKWENTARFFLFCFVFGKLSFSNCFCRCISSTLKNGARNVFWLLGLYHPETEKKYVFLNYGIWWWEVQSLFNFCQLLSLKLLGSTF